jgi:PTS system mannose-specific IID component
MRGTLRAFLRLLTVQASWNYERMQGIGMGYAAEPLLEDLKSADPGRHAEAVARSAEYFNCHPYLAGLAVGALARAEHEGTPGSQILRFRTALCSPLGALGDQVFWTGLLPALVGLCIVAIAAGAGLWAIGGFLLVFNACRLATAWWALRTGLASGFQVATALQESWLPRLAERLGPVAGLLSGLALPAAAGYLLAGAPAAALLAAALIGAVGMVLFRRLPVLVTALRYGLLLSVGSLLWVWGSR